MFVTCECFTTSDNLRKLSECKVAGVNVKKQAGSQEMEMGERGEMTSSKVPNVTITKRKNDNKAKEESKCEGDEHTGTGVLPASVNTFPSLLDPSISHYRPSAHLPPFPSISVRHSPPDSASPVVCLALSSSLSPIPLISFHLLFSPSASGLSFSSTEPSSCCSFSSSISKLLITDSPLSHSFSQLPGSILSSLSVRPS